MFGADHGGLIYHIDAVFAAACFCFRAHKQRVDCAALDPRTALQLLGGLAGRSQPRYLVAIGFGCLSKSLHHRGFPAPCVALDADEAIGSGGGQLKRLALASGEVGVL